PTPSPSPSPSPEPPPPPPPPTTSRPPPLTVDAGGESFDCGLLGSYRLRFAASASQPIARAQVTYQIGSSQPVTERMDVDGSVARFETDRLTGRSRVEWSVSVVAEDGRRTETATARFDPCE
ncbi:MAG: hypothetical protein ACRDT2_04245, partial [Natronosporangium sp.]